HAGDGAGRAEARRAVAEVAAADGGERLAGAVHEVGPGAAVDVQIDEPRGEVQAAEINGLFAGMRAPIDRGDPSVLGQQAGPAEQDAGEYQRRVRENRYSHRGPPGSPG